MTAKRLTHFLCLPLITTTSKPQLQAALASFTSDVTTNRTPEAPGGIPLAAIRPLGTLHLTLGVMNLATPERIESAISLLRTLDLQALLLNAAEAEGAQQEMGKAAAGLRISLRGLKSMHDPSKSSILYISPWDPSGQLQRFCEALQKVFLDADLLVKDDRPLLLHATVVNTIYVPGVRSRDGGRAGHGKHKAKMTLDVRGVLHKYGSFSWGEDLAVERVAVCRMGARKLVDAEGKETGEEEYEIQGSVKMP